VHSFRVHPFRFWPFRPEDGYFLANLQPGNLSAETRMWQCWEEPRTVYILSNASPSSTNYMDDAIKSVRLAVRTISLFPGEMERVSRVTRLGAGPYSHPHAFWAPQLEMARLCSLVPLHCECHPRVCRAQPKMGRVIQTYILRNVPRNLLLDWSKILLYWNVEKYFPHN
jgi:hypothetical protein